MRSFDRCLATQAWHVFRKLHSPSFFVSTVNDADTFKADHLRMKYIESKVKIDAVESQPDCIAELRAKGCQLPAEWYKGQPYTHEPYAISVHPQAVARQLWQLRHAWETFPLSEYDIVIRMRPDSYFHRFGTCSFSFVPPSLAMLPWWGSFGGVNDRFAVLGQKAAKAYFTTYTDIPVMLSDGCPLHPETLIAESLARSGVEAYRKLSVEFATLRTTGEMRYPEMTTSDLAEYTR